MSKPPQLNLSDAYWFQEGPGIRNWQFTTSGIKLLNVGNIEKSGRINLAKTDRHISLEEAHGKYKHFLCDEGDLVIASSGISIDDDGYLRTRGAFVESEHLPLCINTSTIRFKSINGNELRYLKHWLQSNEFRNQITKLVTGSAQLNFGPSHLKQLKVYLPPLAQQQRIAAILDKAAELKTKRENAIAKLDELAQSTFLEMFGDVVSNSKNWNQLTIEEIAANEKYSIVDGPFGSSLKPADYLEAGVPVIRIANVTKDGNFLAENLLYISKEKFIELKRSSIGGEDVLVTRVGTIGNTCIFPNNFGDALLSTTGVCKIKPNRDLLVPTYLHAAIKTKSFQAQINKSASTSVQKYFNLSALKSWKISVPPLELQIQFTKKMNALKGQVVIHRLCLQRIEFLTASLQHQAFTTGFAA